MWGRWELKNGLMLTPSSGSVAREQPHSLREIFQRVIQKRQTRAFGWRRSVSLLIISPFSVRALSDSAFAEKKQFQGSFCSLNHCPVRAVMSSSCVPPHNKFRTKSAGRAYAAPTSSGAVCVAGICGFTLLFIGLWKRGRLKEPLTDGSSCLSLKLWHTGGWRLSDLMTWLLLIFTLLNTI